MARQGKEARVAQGRRGGAFNCVIHRSLMPCALCTGMCYVMSVTSATAMHLLTSCTTDVLDVEEVERRHREQKKTKDSS